MCARLVGDPVTAILFVGPFTPEALDALLETLEFKDCLAALGLEQAPPHFRTARAIWAVDFPLRRMTIATLSFPYPATPEDREACHYWVRGTQRLPDGREVENALEILFPRTKPGTPEPEEDDPAKRRLWMSGTKARLGLLDISSGRYDMYRY